LPRDELVVGFCKFEVSQIAGLPPVNAGRTETFGTATAKFDIPGGLPVVEKFF
jgi:hypothetical protein